MTDKTLEEIASDAADTAAPDSATAPAVAAELDAEAAGVAGTAAVPVDADADADAAAPADASADSAELEAEAAGVAGTAAVPADADVDAEADADPEAVAAVAAPVASGTAVSKATIADIEEAMKDVVDPELGINVVDLGLLYDAHVDDDNLVTLDMTLTSAACPLTDVIEDQTRQALTTGPGGGLVKDFRINWVWLPPWGPDKITDDGREQLRALGFNV